MTVPTASLSPIFGSGQQGFTNQGVVLSGGLLHVYTAGTTTPATTYSDVTLSTPNTNPIVFASSGRPAVQVWLAPGAKYKFVLKDSNSNVLGTWDNIPGISSVSDANDIAYVAAVTNAVARTIRAKLRETVSVFDGTGPVGSDITDAVLQTLAYCHTIVSGHPDGQNYTDIGTACMEIPAGVWTYAGNAFATSSAVAVAIKGASRDVCQITLTNSDYMIKPTGQINTFEFTGVKLVGGKGLLYSSSTAQNTLGWTNVHNNYFFNFTEAALRWKFSDFPYWEVDNNIFHGYSTALGASTGAKAAIGIVTSGLTDSSRITRNAFENCYAGIKLGAGATACHIRDNEFINFGQGSNDSAGIWIVPSTNTPTGSAATGRIFLETNKWGNENLLTTDYRVLIAEETSEFVWNVGADSSKYVGQLVTKDNDVWGTGASSRAFVYSTTPNLWACDMDDAYSGTPIQAINFRSQPANDNNTTHNTKNRIKQNFVASSSYLCPTPSTYGAGWVEDYESRYQGATNVPATHTTGQDGSYVSLLSTLVNSFSTSSASLSQVTDAGGGNDAVEMTMTANGAGIGATLSGMAPNRVAWLTFDIRQGTSLPLPSLLYKITDGASQLALYGYVPVSTYWQEIRIPFWINSAGYASVNTLNFISDAYSVGVATKIRIGRVRVYHAHSPVATNARMLDSGWVAWTPGAVAAGTPQYKTVSVTGAKLGDTCLASYDKYTNGFIITAEVSADDTVLVSMTVTTGGGTPTAGNVRVKVIKAI